MPELRLEPLAAMATSLLGETVVVRFEDLSKRNAVGTASKIAGRWQIALDWSLGTYRRDEFSNTFYHELGHCWYEHAPSDQAEREAEAFAERIAAACGAGLPWRLAHSDLNWEAERYLLPKFARFAVELRAERGGVRSTMPAASTRRTATRQPYTPTALEAEYRSGALNQARQTVRGTVESMIARSLGLPNGEDAKGGVEWAVAGGFVRAR